MVEDVQAAHIHQGGIGENGPVAFEFIDNGDGTMSVEATEITQEQSDDLLAGQWYINVHTLDNPSGEVRGQIVDSNIIVIVTFSLDGSQEVPPVDSEASGTGYATVNTDTNEVELTVVTENAEDATAAHVHEGFVGENGDVVIALVQGDSPGVWTTPDESILDDETLQRLVSGGHYVNVHTPANPPGEIRGQILSNDFTLITFSLDGGQEVPPVESEASGDGYLTFNSATEEVDLKVITTGAEDAVAAHLHEGFAGQNGDIVVALEQDPDDPGKWTTPDGTTLGSDIIELLLSGGHYVNVHTPANPPGEIRGQILTSDFTLFIFPLDGSQEVPPVETEAFGTGYATFNSETNNLQVNVVTSGVDDAEAAHVHEGPIGENGDVVVGLVQDADDVTVWSTPEDTELDDDTAETLLSGGHYINVHTPANPPGEIRGQIE
ncbi:CHRD domain-containing protein [Photobacterium alginatilyticum]|uniref:CHRD domain-containing protein n=2 Tax=Photobacterium alginatilyticum TaxID=1775171 RepID=A0ABW9YDV1_9GAMM|nr:CHRD domain-containing protein [Photobacterium alginatilyticum]